MPPITVPWQFRSAGQNTPLSHLDDNFAALVDAFNSRLTLIGPLASRPAAGTAGRIYIALDERYSWYFDDGATWRPVGGAGSDLVGGITTDPGANAIRLFGAASGAGGNRIITAQHGTAPTTSPADVAQAWTEDIQGVLGRTGWVSRAEDAGPMPFDPVLFRRVGNPFHELFNSAVETTIATFTFAVNTLLPPRSVEVALRFGAVCNANDFRNITMRLKLGATTLATLVYTRIPTSVETAATFIHNIDALTANVQRIGAKANRLQPPGGLSSLPITLADGALDAATALTLTLTGQNNQTEVGFGWRAYALTVRYI